MSDISVHLCFIVSILVTTQASCEPQQLSVLPGSSTSNSGLCADSTVSHVSGLPESMISRKLCRYKDSIQYPQGRSERQTWADQTSVCFEEIQESTMQMHSELVDKLGCWAINQLIFWVFRVFSVEKNPFSAAT